jgi:hypothetical protein
MAPNYYVQAKVTGGTQVQCKPHNVITVNVIIQLMLFNVTVTVAPTTPSSLIPCPKNYYVQAKVTGGTQV